MMKTRMAADYRGFLMSGANEGYARAADPSEFLWPTMKYKGFIGSVAFSEADGVFSGK